MISEIKKKWVEALRSGKYKQGFSRLKYNNGEDVRYCCLGVLCEISGRGSWNENNIYVTPTAAEKLGLPLEVIQWAGLAGDDADPYIGVEHASVWNDSRGHSFEQIADLIEEHL